jgi:hypothetical protein
MKKIWSSSISLLVQPNHVSPTSYPLDLPISLISLSETEKRLWKLKTDLSNQPNAENEFKPREKKRKKKARYIFLPKDMKKHDTKNKAKNRFQKHKCLRKKGIYPGMNKKKRKKTSTKRTRYMTAQFETLQGRNRTFRGFPSG